MANKNIDEMVKELKQAFPDNWGKADKGLSLDIIDINQSWYGVKDGFMGFMEDCLFEINFEYKSNKANVVITSEKELRFELADGYINDFADIGKIVQIIGKHLKSIELNVFWMSKC